MDYDAKARLQKELYQQSLDNLTLNTPPSVIDSSPPELPPRRTPTPPTSRPTVPPSIPIVDDLLINLSLAEETQALPKPSTEAVKWWENGEPLPRADKRALITINPFQETSDSYLREEGSLDNNKSKLARWTPIQPVSISSATANTNGASNLIRSNNKKTLPSGGPAIILATSADDGYEHAVVLKEDESNVSSAFGFWNNKQTTTS
ncbi:hypothetical protein BX666DRAFT_161481 [Dichotomocladium elegans]|nr:hypothetical protein BX666DRAFT_161481 [Dichotomocladium elegans]